MKFKRRYEGIELPEKSEPTKYINIRSAERVDVRPGETRDIETGVLIKVYADEEVIVYGPYVVTGTYQVDKFVPLVVTMYNDEDRSLLIYPGQIIGGLSIRKEAARNKMRKATISSKARFVEDGTDTEGGEHSTKKVLSRE